MANSYGPQSIVQDGLVFTMDAGNTLSYTSGSTTVYNIMGNNTGSMINSSDDGIAIDSSEGGGSWRFDGTDERIDCDTFTNIVGAGSLANYTIEIWVKGDSYQRGDLAIGNKTTLRHLGGYSFYWHELVGFIADGTWGSSGRIFPQTNNANYSDWQQVTVTYDGSNVYIYSNAIVGSGTTTQTGDMNAAGEQFCIGGTNQTGNLEWDGWITAIKVYNRALSASEILQNYNATKNRFQ